MKKNKYLPLWITLILLSACQKDPLTRPVEFNSTVYQNLSNFNSLGKPDNLLKDTISPAMLTYIDNFLPDGKNLSITHPELFTSNASPDIVLTQKSDVYLTFVSGNAGNCNSVAFYNFPSNQPPINAGDIKLITYVFPNAGRLTPLMSGDKMKIGTFDAGTSLGIVLMQNAWDTTNHKMNNNAVHFCSTDALNPEVAANLKRHAVLIHYAPENKQIIGFEDRDRTLRDCDNDFNDVVLYWTVKPI